MLVQSVVILLSDYRNSVCVGPVCVCVGGGGELEAGHGWGWGCVYAGLLMKYIRIRIIFISEIYHVSNIKINLLLMGAKSWKSI